MEISICSYGSCVLGDCLNGNIEGKEMETSVTRDGTSEVKLNPEDGVKEINRDEYEDPIRKPLLLDDGRWAVFSW